MKNLPLSLETTNKNLVDPEAVMRSMDKSLKPGIFMLRSVAFIIRRLEESVKEILLFPASAAGITDA